MHMTAAQTYRKKLIAVAIPPVAIDAASDVPIPDNLRELEQWAATHLAGRVEINTRAPRGARASVEPHRDVAEGDFQQAECAADPAYCLYDNAADKRREADGATAYNAPVADWTEPGRPVADLSREDANRPRGLEM